MAEFYNDEDNKLITGTSGDDSIYNNSGYYVTIDGGKGNDLIYNDGSYVTINDGAGNDFIYNDGSYVTINGGAGKDTIEGFNETSTLQISGGSYSTTKSGDNIIVTVGKGKISLIGAASLSSVNITGEETPTETNSWQFSGTTVKYGTSSNTLFTIKGVTSISGISFSGTTVTISKASLGTDKVTISDGYTLKLADDVSKSTTKGAWSYSNSTATYKQTTTAGYALVDNAITYTKATSKTLFTIKGVKSVSGLSLSGTTVTVENSSLNKSKVTISDGYTLKLGSDVTKPTNKAAWSLSGTTATYKQTKSAGYTLADNVITYSKASSETAAIIKGVKSKSGLSVSGNVIKLKNSSLNSKVTVSGGYVFDFQSDYNNAMITGSSSADTIIARGKNISIDGGKGNDSLTGGSGADTFIYKSGDGNDTISGFDNKDALQIDGSFSASYKNSALILKVGSGSVTLEDFTATTFNINDATYKISGSKLVKGGSTKTENNSWKINGAKATYGTSSKTLVTVSGVTSTDGLDIDGKVVTVSKSSLGTKNVTISGGYTLALGDDVSAPATKKASWDLDESTATYKGSYNTAGYKLSSNSKKITYSKATTAKELATITGAKSTSGLTPSGKVIKLKNSNLNKRVTVSGSYEFDFASDYSKATITGSSSADTIIARGKNILVNGGKGDDTIKIIGSGTVKGGDGKDTFFYNSSKANVINDYDAEDIISIKSGTADVETDGDDVIFNGKITVTGGANQTITYYDAGGKKTYVAESTPDSDSETILPATYSKASFKFSDTLLTLDASDVLRGLKITGNAFKNNITGTSDKDTIDGGDAADTIYGGDGNDSLFGGAGNDIIEGGKGNDLLKGGDDSDIFIYKSGDGNDTIEDYSASDNDTIKFDSVKISDSDITSSDGNIIFNVGSGSLTLKNVGNQEITYIDASNKEKVYNNSTPIIWNGNHKSVTLKSGYSSANFNQKNYNEYVDKLETIDASAVNHAINIVGNEKANSILGGSQNDYIDGDAGSDTIKGGDGSDTIVGGAGDDILYGDDGADVFYFTTSDGNDIIADFKTEDKIQVAANTSDVKGSRTSGDDVIFSIGNLKITVTDGADKYIPVYDNFGKILDTYEPPLYQIIGDDDEFLSDETQLSSIVKNNSVDYALYSADTTLNLTTDKNVVPVISNSGKK